MKFKVLHIDAWADCCGCYHDEYSPTACWTWNNWFVLGEYDTDIFGDLNERSAMEFFKKEWLKEGAEKDFYIDDDHYNLVLTNKNTDMPVIAIEYGR